MIRAQMPTGELGTWLALIIGVGGAIGVFGCGVVADHWSPGRAMVYVMPAVACAIALPFQFGVYYFATDPYFTLTMAIVPAVLSNAYLAATIATVHGLVGLRILGDPVFILNIIGLGAGRPPWVWSVICCNPATASNHCATHYYCGAAGTGLVRHPLCYCGPLCAGGPGRRAGLTGAAGRLRADFVRPVTLGNTPSDRWAARVVAASVHWAQDGA